MLSLSVFLALIDNEEDRKKFAVFYEKHKDYALNVALSLLHNYSVAEDAVQDAFGYLAEHPWRVLKYEESSAKSFLSELIRDFSNNIIRKESAFKKVPLYVIDMDISRESFSRTAENAMIEEVKDAILKLNETDQAIIRLFYIHKYKTKEIAKMLKLSDSNVRKRLQRARETLKKELEEHKEEVYG